MGSSIQRYTMKKTPIFLITLLAILNFGYANTKQNMKDFIPKGYKIFETISGDINKDGIEDRVLIIKGINKKKIVRHEYLGMLDRNRSALS